MTEIALQHYLAVGAIMFVIGMIGFMTRRNMIVMFLCTELMFQGVAINLIAFGRYHGNLGGQAFVIFVLVIAAAEATSPDTDLAGRTVGGIAEHDAVSREPLAACAVGFTLMGVLLFRQRNTLDADAWRDLKG